MSWWPAVISRCRSAARVACGHQCGFEIIRSATGNPRPNPGRARLNPAKIGGCTRPSYGDLQHVRSTLARAKNAKTEQFFLPIVCGGQLYPYIVKRDRPNEVGIAKLIII